MKIDYNIFYRDEMPLNKKWNYHADIFISAFNLSERVNFVFNKIKADNKRWIVHQEYSIDPALLPDNNCFICNCDSKNDYREDDFCHEIISHEIGTLLLSAENICIDITGFIKPYMMTLISWLVSKGKKKIDILFSEPKVYAKKANTTFAGEFNEIRPVAGYYGIGHSTGTEEETLVIGAGYDDALISGVAENKSTAIRKIQIFGFPSLRADMYQENVLRATRAAVAAEFNYTSREDPFQFFAPANDPFATASVLQHIFRKYNKSKDSWYLCPVSTKSQALGFILFYLNECQGMPVSIIYPFGKTHEAKTSEGVARIWKYTLEFPGA